MALAVCVPATLEMIVGEQLNLAVDFTNLISPGDTLTVGPINQTAVVQSASTGEVITSAIIGAPYGSFQLPSGGSSPNGRPGGYSGNLTPTDNNILNVTLSSSYLSPQTDYILELTILATNGNGTKTISAILKIKIIY